MKDKLTRKQLIDLVRKIALAEGSEDEINEWLEVVEENVPHPEVSDLIFYPEDEMSPEEIVAVALAYKPVQL